MSRKSLRSGEDDIEDFRDRNLSEIVSHAAENSEFYRKFWAEKGFEPSDFNTVEDLGDAPVVEKEMVKDNLEDVRTEEGFKDYLSTGSSGDRLSVPFDEQAADWREAITVRTELLKGYKPFQSIVEFYGKSQSRTGSFLRPKRAVSRESSVEKQIEILESEDPDYLIYGGHVLFRICKHLRQGEGLDADIEGVFGNGELITPEMRKLIEEELETELYSVYETSEFGQIAYECPEGGYHVNEDLVHLEVLDENDEPVEIGEKGYATVTGLVNRAFPLIRYRIGDIVIKGEKDCSCDTEFGKIKRIEGRAGNVMKNDDGEKIYPRQITDRMARYHELDRFVFEKEGSVCRLRYEDAENTDTEALKEELGELGFREVEMVEDDIELSGSKALPVRNLDK